jgi:hypothetical protein
MSFDVETIAERKIQDAIKDGAFDNLPGKGKPLDLDSDSGIPPEMRAASRILKNANVPPDWIQLDKGIRHLIENCRSLRLKFELEYQRRIKAHSTSVPSHAIGNRAESDFPGWYSRESQRYLEALRQVNGEILKYNFIAPNCTQRHVPFRLAQEMQALFSTVPPPADAIIPHI